MRNYEAKNDTDNIATTITSYDHPTTNHTHNNQALYPIHNPSHMSHNHDEMQEVYQERHTNNHTDKATAHTDHRNKRDHNEETNHKHND